MRILFLVHAFNSLSQRLWVELTARGHEVAVEYDINDAVSTEAAALFRPDLILAPFLKRAIPEVLWRRHRCLVVHPGIAGDRGPAALDRAILRGEAEWGVTVLEATGELDAGPIWAEAPFPMRAASKSSLYRHEVTEAAVHAVLTALSRLAQPGFRPRVQDYRDGTLRGRPHPALPQAERAIDWQRDDTATVLRKIRSADGVPGVRDALYGQTAFLHDVRPEPVLRGPPGALLARSGPALCRATVDGAVWIGHVRLPAGAFPFKLPATLALPEAASLPEAAGYEEVRYEEEGAVGYLHFPFYNGAMGVRQCALLRAAYAAARARPTRVIVLLGGPDFWSNGLHLNLIEAADSPADESWRNIEAMDDLAHDILTTASHLTVAALRGNAGAGGVYLARAADFMWLRAGGVLSPHYRDMGNLYGSEYWTYLLPRRVGAARAAAIMRSRLPLGAAQALADGLVDAVLDGTGAPFLAQVRQHAAALAAAPDFAARLEAKRRQRAADEADKPLARYRAEELERMRLNFYGFDPSYHVARYNFVYKVPKSRTPVTIARHRDRPREAS